MHFARRLAASVAMASRRRRGVTTLQASDTLRPRPEAPKEPTMNTMQRLTGLALAILLTVTMLGGIDRLAHEPAGAAHAA
jgi:hypothetical protein